MEDKYKESLLNQLEASKKETARLEQLIKEQGETPKVGDIYRFDGTYSFKDAVMMVVQVETSNKVSPHDRYYCLIIIQCKNSPQSIGQNWAQLEKNINDIFGGVDKKRFTKLP